MSVRIYPAGCVFADKGPVIFADERVLPALLGLANSTAFRGFVSLQMAFGSFEVGVVQRCPMPSLAGHETEKLGELALNCANLRRNQDRAIETSHVFHLPALLHKGGATIAVCASSLEKTNAILEEQFSQNQRLIDELAFDLYRIAKDDRRALESSLSDIVSADSVVESEPDDTDDHLSGGISELTGGLFSYILGCAFGRWDIRYATGEQAAPELPDPFAPLPVCPPGQLQNAQGLPLGKEEVGRMKEEGIWSYPIEIPWDGILVDDPNHPLDIERRVREVIEIIWSGQERGPTAEAIEHEACEILGVKSLRDYFRKPAGFFADHLKRYSKSRRQAPIYWPLSTASGSYTLWIYYHRLTPDTLYKCLQQFVEPKIREIEQDLVRLRAMDEAGEGGRQTRDQLAKAETLRTELLALRDELAHWAPRWKLNLNDGVQITASPLWKLFLLPKWRKTLEQNWKELDRGDYDWAHLAHTLHPSRVREKCKTDRSLAIAHSLEDLCQIQAPAQKKKRGKKAQTEEELI
jgi:hypothetical protein